MARSDQEARVGHAPEPARARAVERYLVSTIDHGFNASTFAARVVASTGATLVAAVTAALGALAGPLHGGAPDRALDLIDEIRATGDDPAHAADRLIRAKVAAGERIMGFGHRVYRTEDPRAVLMRETGRTLDGRFTETAQNVQRQAEATLAELKPGRGLHANVEFYAGVVMELAGIPRELFTPTFAVSRVVGWTANILEQAEDPAIYRPLSRYVGTEPIPGERITRSS